MGTSSSSTPSESTPTPPRLIPICSNGTWTISAPFTVNSVTSNEDKLETLLQTYASQQGAAVEIRSFSIDGTDYTIAVMEGATPSKIGKKGFVPAPPASSNAPTLYLNGSGQWARMPMPIDNLNNTSTADSLSANQGKVLNETKASIASPVFTGSISLGRDSDSDIGNNSFAVGVKVRATSQNSHAEGAETTASGEMSHAEGRSTTASGEMSHAEGVSTTASSMASHAEGQFTTASGASSHTEGQSTTASGISSHAEGRVTTANGIASHAEGVGTIADGKSTHIFGEFNYNGNSGAETGSRGQYVEIVGNGTKESARSNARTLDWSGSEWLAGNLTAAGGSITIGSTTMTETQLQSLLANSNIPSANGVIF